MVSSFPGLFAAAHVLLRLLAPRHPPCALSLLIMKNTVVAAMEFSRCTRTICAELKGRLGRSLKTQQRESACPVASVDGCRHGAVVEVDVILGDPAIRTSAQKCIHRRGREPPE